MINTKVHFLQHEYIPLLHKLKTDQKGVWGKMDGQQMVEHMRDVCKVANGKMALPLMNTDPEKLAKARDFMMSNEPFKENTRVPVMPEDPRAHKYASLEEAITKLEPELNDVFVVYAADAHKKLMHPMFGELDYEQQIHYLYKHAQHHLRQFGLID